MLKDNEQRFFDALKKDLGRPVLETELYVSPHRCACPLLTCRHS